eukprot:scaffold1220_cov259-Pinguiococcus_pyrenoidosus.AAC.38
MEASNLGFCGQRRFSVVLARRAARSSPLASPPVPRDAEEHHGVHRAVPNVSGRQSGPTDAM